MPPTTEPRSSVLTRRAESAQDRRLKGPPYEFDACVSKCFPLCRRNLHCELRHRDVHENRKRCYHRKPPQFSSRVHRRVCCTGKKFNATAFNAKVNEGNAKFQQAIADEKFTARRPVLVDLKAQFDADAAHLKSKASRGKITPALASEMKNDINKTLRSCPRAVRKSAKNLRGKNPSSIQRSIRSATNRSQRQRRNFRICSAQAKGDTSELVRQNAEELERRLVLLKKRKIDKEDFDFFVENQKRDLRVFVDGQPAQAAGTRRKTDDTCSGDSCEGGDRIDLAVTADALRTARTTASQL